MSKYLRYYLLLILSGNSYAGVTNPNISAIGQVFGTYTDDTRSPAARKAALSLGETELVLDAALNPYFNGMFVLSIDAKGGLDVEEAYTTMVRGLPLNLAIKAGKFRLDFGKLNQAHPHAYPFIRTPRVLDPGAAGLLPGEESFDEPAIQVSTLFPVTDNWSVMLSADALQGSSFHPDDSGRRSPGFLICPIHSSSTRPQSISVCRPPRGRTMSPGARTPRFSALTQRRKWRCRRSSP